MANINKPQNYVEQVRRSVHDLSTERRTTLHAGLNIPIFSRKMLPNDSISIDVATLLQSNPLVAPLMSQYKLRVALFFEPYSNLYGWMDNNTRESTEALLKKNHHRACLGRVANTGGSSIFCGRSSLFEYCGVPALAAFSYGDAVDPYYMNLDRHLAYLDIIRNYYINRQEDSVPYIGNSFTNFDTVSVETLDNLFMDLRYLKDGFTWDRDASTPNAAALQWLVNEYLPNAYHYEFGGLFSALFEPDYFSNLLSNDVGTVKSNITVSEDGTVSMHEVYFQNKLQKLIDRFDVSGGVFSKWMRTVWGTNPNRRVDVPEIIGSVTSMINANNITTVANTYQDTTGDGSAVGQLAGQINQHDNRWRDKNRKFQFDYHAREEGILMAVVTLIPCVDYDQGIDPDLLRTTFADDYKPQFAQLGFQDIPMDHYSVMPQLQYNSSSNSIQTVPGQCPQDSGVSVGKQVAWLDMMTDWNRSYGEFSTSGMYETWTLKRRFWKRATGADVPQSRIAITRYIDPVEFQYPFVMQTIEDPNFFLQVGFDIRAVRPIIKQVMPSFD